MKNKNILSYLIITSGVFVALFSILLDSVGLGKDGIQAAQLLGVQTGMVISLFGILLNILQRKSEVSFRSFWLILQERLFCLAGLPWVILGMLPSFIAFLVLPMFFGSRFRFEYITDYLKRLTPIGNDLRLTLDAVQMWLQNHQTTEFVFTPLTNFLFAPFLLLGYPRSFYFVLIATLLSYLTLGILAVLMSNRRNHSLVVFIATVSIFSYGLQFEIERGQSHTIALMLVVLAIYIFHKYPDYRFFAYLFFCVSVQLKFYPAVFVVMFVDDWRDWKNTIQRFVALGLANILLLFMYGFTYFSVFYNSMVTDANETFQMIPENHSIRSFVFFLFDPEHNLFSGNALRWVTDHAGLIENTLYVYFLICFAVVLIDIYLKNARGFNADLLMVCVIGGVVLPSVSHDYSLPLLMAPFAMVLADWYKPGNGRARPLTILVTIIVSLAYSLTLFPIAYKPVFLQNSLPMIFVILIGVALMSITRRSRPIGSE